MLKRILIVEDTPVTLAMAKKKLEAHGYIVNTATNGLEGMDKVRQYDFDLIITDVVMPQMDGVDFYKELKKNVTTRHIPILIITDNQIFKEAFSSLGVEGFIPKPLDSQALIDEVNKNFMTVHEETFLNKQKILICGTNELKVAQIITLLESRGQRVWKLDNSTDLITNALTLLPDVLLIDVLMKDVPTAETIKAMRCFSRFENLTICLFSCVSPSLETHQDTDGFDKLEDAVQPCMKAGANLYLGRFVRSLFAEKLKEISQIKKKSL